jgi:hypothetical protein
MLAYWTVRKNIARQLPLHRTVVLRFTLAMESLGHGFKELPNTLSNVWDAVQNAGKKVIANAIGRPLLYAAGGVLVGGTVIYLLMRRG